MFNGGMCHTHNSNWWISLDLGSEKCIDSIVVHNRIDPPHDSRILNAKIGIRKSKNGIDVWSETFDQVQNIYAFDVSSELCSECENGKYQDERGFNATACKECDAGYIPNADKNMCSFVGIGSDP